MILWITLLAGVRRRWAASQLFLMGAHVQPLGSWVPEYNLFNTFDLFQKVSMLHWYLRYLLVTCRALITIVGPSFVFLKDCFSLKPRVKGTKALQNSLTDKANTTCIVTSTETNVSYGHYVSPIWHNEHSATSKRHSLLRYERSTTMWHVEFRIEQHYGLRPIHRLTIVLNDVPVLFWFSHSKFRSAE